MKLNIHALHFAQTQSQAKAIPLIMGDMGAAIVTANQGLATR
jgi:hypothetical protein